MGPEPRINYFEVEPGEERFVEILTELFSDHWKEIVFGPALAGASYEIKIGEPPEVTYRKGYLTVTWTRGAHFHLSVGVPAPEKRVSRAAFFEMEGSCVPKSWGLRFWNGAGEEILSIYFPNAYLTPEGKTGPPDWSQLKLWESFRSRYTALPR